MSDTEKTILVVEDERPLAEAVKVKLENEGFEVMVARSTEQAMRYLQDGTTVDAIWLDHYLLGKEDGLDLVSTLKQSEGEWRRIPVFVVSNTASEDKVQSYLQLGIDQYYTKTDHRLEEIVSEIRDVLNKELE